MRAPVRVLLVLILLLAGSVSASEGLTATKSVISVDDKVADHTAAEAGGFALIPPGELDTTFGTGGKSLIDLGGLGGNDEGNDLALQPDGKIVVAGSFTTTSTNFAVARLLVPQGTLDTSYGLGHGWSNLDFGRADVGQAVALQPDGKIVVAGYSALKGPADFAVARVVVPDGTFDPFFGGGTGRSLIDLGGLGGNDEGNDLALQPDGKIIVAGSFGTAAGNNFAVARLLSEGTLDTSYGLGHGWSNLDFGGTDDIGTAVALQPDGKIVVAGRSNASGNNDFAVARLLVPEGTFDPSFGEGNGRLLTDFGGTNDTGRAVALQPDGKIVVAGASGGNFAVVRLEPSGVLDTTFGPGGKSTVDFLGADAANGVALQPDGKIVLAGTSDGNFAVARLQPNGLLDTTFGTGGKSVVDFGGADDYGNAVALQSDGRIVVAGYSNAGGTYDFAVARLEGDPVAGGTPPTCGGKPATIIGTEAADALTGTPKKDVIVGLGGKDKIRAGGASDIVCAGSGNDIVVGGGGKDRIRGEKGKDRLLGGPGADRLIGGPGRDRLIGGPGRDRLIGGPGLDSQQQ